MRVKIVAEIGVNHNGSRDLAGKLIRAAKQCGADAVKIQIFNTADMVTRTADQAGYQKKSRPDSKTQYDLLKKYELGFEDIACLKKSCEELNIELMATPFDFASLDMMVKFSFQTVKISSGDITNIPLLKRVEQTGKSVIISTGMANLGEIEEALAVFPKDKSDLALLHCTSNYPTEMADVNLLAIQTLKEAFKKKVGYSDHTAGIDIPIAAVALGAEIIEKHFTLDSSLPGPDHRASLEPQKFVEMVKSIRGLETALGNGVKRCQDSEIEVKNVVRKSIVAKANIKAGEYFTENNLALKRPGTGLHPRYYNILLGKKAKLDIIRDQQIKFMMIEEEFCQNGFLSL